MQYQGKGVLAAVICCVCACFGLGITATVYMGIYAFNNPDAPAIYYETLGGKPELASPDNVPLGALEIDDIHDRFVTWFYWGFFQCLFGFVLIAFL